MTRDLNTTFGHRSIYISRRFHSIMRRTIPVEPLEPIEPAEHLSHAIKGQNVPGVNTEPFNPLLDLQSTLCYYRLYSITSDFYSTAR